jgi:ribosome-associated toxin RatA of RatAB toxin-antitoxin module
MIRHLLVAVAAMAAASPAPAENTVRVAVEPYSAGVRVAAEVDVHAGVAVAWEALTDYNHWTDFMPDLKVSRVISKDPLRVEQRGSLPWLPGFPIVIIADVQETPNERVHFRKIEGNVAYLEGEWRLKGMRETTRVSYRAMVEPGFPLPPSLTADIFREDTRVKVEAMAREILRRSAR